MSLARLPIYLSQITNAPAPTTPGAGSGSGSLAYAGNSSGKRAPRAVGIGSLVYASSASGKRTARANGTGTASFAGLASGNRTAIASATGTTAYAGTGTAVREPIATGLGSLTITSLATGLAPVVPVRTGDGSGVWSFVGTGDGWRDPLAIGTGTQVRTAAALGAAPTQDSAPPESPTTEDGPLMPLSPVTITFDIADLAGVDFDPRRTKVYATTNVPSGVVIDTVGNQIRLGSGNATISADGTGSISLWAPGTGSNPASWQTTIHIDYPDRNAPSGRKVQSLGPFTLTASANLADLVAEMPVQPEFAGQFLATVQDMIDESLEGYTPVGGGGSGSTSLIVVNGGTVDLDNTQPNGYLIGYKVTAQTNFEGVAFPIGRYIFERDSSSPNGWVYRTLANGSAFATPTVGDPIPVMATAPTFTDPSSTASDTYTIPAVTGVKYYANAVLKGAGVHPGVGTVTIDAEAEAGYVIVGTKTWVHTFDASGAVALPTTLLSDTFTKADNTLINGSVANTGQTWVGHPGADRIQGGKYAPTQSLQAQIELGTLPATWAVEADIKVTSEAKIYLRNTSTAYDSPFVATPGIYLTWQSGVPRVILRADDLGSNFTETFNPSVPGGKYAIVPGADNTTVIAVKVQVSGTTMTCYANGTKLLEGTLSSSWLDGLTGTKLVMKCSGAEVDNLKVMTT